MNLHIDLWTTYRMSRIHYTRPWWKHYWWRCWCFLCCGLCRCGSYCSSCPWWFCNIILNSRVATNFGKTTRFLLLDVFLLFLVYRSRKHHFCYCSYGSREFNNTCTRIFYMHVFESWHLFLLCSWIWWCLFHGIGTKIW